MKRKVANFLAVLLLSAGIVGEAAAQGVDPVSLRPAIIAQERNNPMLLALPSVVGTAVGVDAQGDPVVKVYATSGAVRGLPSAVDGIPVQMEVTGQIVAFQRCTGPPWTRPPECNGGDDGDGGDDGNGNDDGNGGDDGNGDSKDPTDRFDRPVPIGVSTGHPDVTAGTICCRVSNSQGHQFALSNNHVYADQNGATIGVDPALQPGPYDGGQNPGDSIGILYDFEPIVFSRRASNLIDAAIVRVNEDDDENKHTLGVATPSVEFPGPRTTPIEAVPEATVGMDVKKFGRSTELTFGYVDAINATVQVRFKGGFARFVGQIVIRPGSFSAPGDSGSLIVAHGGENDRKAVGLLFAGSSSVTIANPIQEVLSRLGLAQVDGSED